MIKAKSIDPALLTKFEKIAAQLKQLTEGGERDTFKVEPKLRPIQSQKDNVLYQSSQLVLRESRMIEDHDSKSFTLEGSASLRSRASLGSIVEDEDEDGPSLGSIPSDASQVEVEMSGAPSEHSDIS